MATVLILILAVLHWRIGAWVGLGVSAAEGGAQPVAGDGSSNNSTIIDEQRKHQHTHHFRPHNVETVIYAQERLLLKQLRAILRERNITVGGFYHTSTRGTFWPQVINEQLKIIDGYFFMPKFNSTDRDLAYGAYHEMKPPRGEKGARQKETAAEEEEDPHGLMDLAEDLFVGVHGDEAGRANIISYIRNLSVSYHDKMRFEERGTYPRGHYGSLNAADKQRVFAEELSKSPPSAEGEFHTFQAMHNYCKRAVEKGENKIVFYFHTKSTGSGKYIAPASSWRDIMNTYTIEFPSICMRALLEGHSTCGTILFDVFYPGTFFWASCNHIAMLPALWNPLNNAYACEAFIFNVSNNWGLRRQRFPYHCAYGCYDVKVNLYDTRVPRHQYIPDVQAKLNSFELPPSTLGGKRDLIFVNEPCASVRSNMSSLKPYAEQSYFEGPNVSPYIRRKLRTR